MLHGVGLFETDVSGLYIVINYKGQASWTDWPLKMGPICSPETSVLNHLIPLDNPEVAKIQFNRGGSLRSCFSRLSSEECDMKEVLVLVCVKCKVK